MAVSEERAAEALRQQVAGSGGTPRLPFAVSAEPNEYRQLDWGAFLRSMALGSVLAAGVYLLISRFLPTVPRAHLGAVGRLVLVSGVLMAAALAPLVHEIGHVAGGAVVRLRFTLPTTMEDVARRTAIVVAAGPATSLALGIVALVTSYLTSVWRSPAAMSDPSLAISGIAAGAFGVCSLGIGLLTLIPGRTGHYATDGAQLLRYIRGGAAADRHITLMTMAAVATGSTRPRDWPRDLIRRLMTDGSASSDAILAESLAYYQALDDGDLPAAHRALGSVLERTIPKGRRARAPYAQEAAFYELVVRGDAAAARRWLDEELGGSIADVPMRKVLVDLLTLTDVTEAGDPAAAARARARVDEALPALATRSGVDALKAELVARRIARLRT